jgi:ankyrin repeat protein
VPVRSLPRRPSLDQLKRQAKELLRRQPDIGRLRDAQRALARDYGFPSWDALRVHVESIVGATGRAIIKPPELDTAETRPIWDAITAADAGDVETLRELIERDASLSRAEYWYTPAIHFAVRDGHDEAVTLLLDAGADPELNGLHDGSLIVMARDRGHEYTARLLEEARDRRGRVRESPLHQAVARRDYETVARLLDGGADVHAVLSSAHGLSGGFWTDLQPIDLALWGGRGPRDPRIIDLLLARGATRDLAVAAALGDIDEVRRILDVEPARIRETRPSGRRPLSAAIEAGHDAVARLLVARGAHPNWREPTAPKGRALHAAATAGKRDLVELLLAHGADPNSDVDSSGNAVVAAATPEIRALLVARGGRPDPYDTAWIDDDEELRRAAADPTDLVRISAAFAMVVGDGRRDRLDRLLAAGLRVPPVLTGCQGYLLAHTDMLGTLLAHGMSPDLVNWQHQTLLHHACNGADYRGPERTAGAVERAAILLAAGADISARDDEYRSTPLAWAARTNALEVAAFLLEHRAPTALSDDAAWATPLAWAERRGHTDMADLLRRHGAVR